MNRKQRARKLERRRNPRSSPTPAMQAYSEISADNQDPEAIRVLMLQRGYLPNGHGGWREMTTRERRMWL